MSPSRLVRAWRVVVAHGYRPLVVLVGVLGATAIVWAINTGEGPSRLWNSFIDPWITTATLLVAAFLGLRALRDELPKKLNLHLVFEGGYALTCWEASLSGEGDIRAWAQQVGRQMSNNALLEFSPFIDLPPSKIHWRGGLRVVYTITLTLTKAPPVAGYKVWGPGEGEAALSADRPARPLSVSELKDRET